LRKRCNRCKTWSRRPRTSATSVRRTRTTPTLGKLQTDVEAVANSPADAAAVTKAQNDALDAKNTANQIARSFTPGSDPDNAVQKLLLDPIANVEAKLRGVGLDELNAGGKALCGQFGAVLHKYPFNPASKDDAKVEDVNFILRQPDGALRKFYDETLKKFLPKLGNQYVQVQGGNVKLNPALVEFFKRAAAFSDLLYAGGAQEPRFTYTLKPVPTGQAGMSGGRGCGAGAGKAAGASVASRCRTARNFSDTSCR
jgi:type VI protein secretion system component VasK